MIKETNRKTDNQINDRHQRYQWSTSMIDIDINDRHQRMKDKKTNKLIIKWTRKKNKQTSTN